MNFAFLKKVSALLTRRPVIKPIKTKTELLKYFNDKTVFEDCKYLGRELVKRLDGVDMPRAIASIALLVKAVKRMSADDDSLGLFYETWNLIMGDDDPDLVITDDDDEAIGGYIG